VLRVPATLKLLAFALVGLWVLLPVASALHGAEHAHRYCAEHGAVEEATPEAGHAPGVDGPGWSAGDEAVEAGHVACGFAFAHRLADGAVTPRRAAQALASWARDAAPLRPSHAVARGLPVLATAPKGSPPAA
jgi:hypothetical protein